MNKPPDERRKHLRVYRNFILTYQEKGKTAIYHNVSQLNNVSKGGLSFTSTYPLAPGAIVTIDLKTPFISDSIGLEGVVLESKEKIQDMIYEVRLQFQNIPPEALTMLEKIETYAKAQKD